MFSTSTGSSPQTAPTTPESISNTSDDFPSSQDLWGSSLTGALSVGDGDYDRGQGAAMDLCSMPLQDLIHDNVISNSPLQRINTPSMLPSAWFNRNNSGTSNTHSASHSGHTSTASVDTSSIFNSPTQYNDPAQAQALPPEVFSQTKAQQHSAPSSAIPASDTEQSTTTRTSVFSAQTDFSARYELRVHDVPRKSRVETQVKLRMELVEVSGAASSEASASNSSFDVSTGLSYRKPATQWKYVKVPKTASVKVKSKNVCEPDPLTVLNLTAITYCATNSEYKTKPVSCCENCQVREQKRNSKKAIGTSGPKTKSTTNSKNPTPATSDAEMYGQSTSFGLPYSARYGGNGEAGHDSTVSPVDFTCHQILDMSNGVTQLSFRIVCYCRHFKEKEGFRILLRLQDNQGNVIGEVKTTPIMITDDHKSIQKLTPAHTADEEEVDSFANPSKRRTKRIVSKHSEGEGRVKVEEDDFEESGVGAIRNKPRSNRMSHLSRSATGISKLTTSSNVSAPAITTTTNIYNRCDTMDNGRRGSQSATHSESPLNTTAPSSPYTGFSPPPLSSNPIDKGGADAATAAFTSLFPSTSTSLPPVPESSLLVPLPEIPMSDLIMSGMDNLTVAPQIPLAPAPNPRPRIDRVIPSSGPKMGGIEVTLLGGNFSREALVNCAIAFGQNVVLFAGADASTTLSAGQASSSTGNGLGVGAQVWNDNVIICTLPPSPVAGPVEVKFLGLPNPLPVLGLPMVEPPAPIFTYIEEEEKDLMIHALQILGWQNSGQWQDAKSVAMNILGSQSQAMGGMMSMDDSSNSDLSSLIGGLGFTAAQGKTANKGGLARQATQSNINQIELGVWNVLRRAQHPVTGVISHISTPHPVTGRTLLHIASALGFSKLVAALIGWKANVDIADKNGFSPVHFACFYGRTECVDILVRMGRAHLEGRDLQGRTPFDVCRTEKARDFVLELEEEVETRRRKSTAPSEIESGGEGDDEKYTTSEADFEEDEEESFQQPEPVMERPQSASRRVSRANSLASIASNRKAARPATPYGLEDIQSLSTVHPADPTPISPASPSSSSSWSLPRNIPMPWPMQFPAGWQFPNVPTMPQFVRRRSVEGEDGDKAQQKEKEMFDWMWMQYFRNQWNMLQQQQRQGAGVGELDNDPPPQYSPPPERQLPHVQEKRGSPNTHTTPSVPTMMDEPPSPLSLDPPSKLGVPPSTSAKIYPVASTSSIRSRQSHRRQRDFSYEDSRVATGELQEYSTHSVGQHATSSRAVVRRSQKKKDTMLIYFWIPVLLLVLAWASYRFLTSMYRLARPALVRQATAFLQEVV
ncbi:hypothetical protein CPB86DRAFT_785406 [Serendipita vermifera]|nr:hypothetical protein CPB86DRAFT_785406 [Serendipita vermifera]